MKKGTLLSGRFHIIIKAANFVSSACMYVHINKYLLAANEATLDGRTFDLEITNVCLLVLWSFTIEMRFLI